MDEERAPLDQLLDTFVYAPIGLALTVQEELPRLVEKGRARLTGQLAMAKLVGRFAVQTGQQEAERLVKQTVERLGDVVPGAQQAPPPPPGSPAPAASTADPDAVRPSADGLAIPGYDTLSASQIVQRLGGLTADELGAVEAYETATRGRRTILSRIAQLDAG